MAETALLSSFDQRIQPLYAGLRRVPASLWRTIIMVLLLLWALYSLSRLVWIIIPSPQLNSPSQVALPMSAQASLTTRNVDLALLQEAQIFGKGVEGELPQEQVAAEQPEISGNVEETKLNLTLVGIVASSDAANSTAVIASGRDQALYQIDDKLPVGNKVTLAKVAHDRVILNNNGNFEALWLYTEADFKVNYNYASSQSAPEEMREEPQEITAKIKPSEVPKSLSEVVRFSVHREEGQMVGFRIRPGKNRELFEQLGLEANDIVTSVNGIPIDSPQAIRDNYQQLKTAISADLEIRRGEENVFVNVSIDTEN